MLKFLLFLLFLLFLPFPPKSFFPFFPLEFLFLSKTFLSLNFLSEDLPSLFFFSSCFGSAFFSSCFGSVFFSCLGSAFFSACFGSAFLGSSFTGSSVFAAYEFFIKLAASSSTALMWLDALMPISFNFSIIVLELTPNSFDNSCILIFDKGSTSQINYVRFYTFE